MKVWTNTTATGYWPVGFAAVVVAETAERAAHFLNLKLAALNMVQSEPIKPAEMVEVDTTKVNVTILADGNY